MLSYKRVGKGKPVVFLHGFLESKNMWDVFELESLPFESILLDLPGHGNSGFNSKPENMSDIANEVIETLRALNLDCFDLVGHSLGGYVAIEIHKALRLKCKLILFHSNFWEDEEEKKLNRNRVIEVVQKNKTLFLKEAIPNLFLEKFRNTEHVWQLLHEAENISTETIVTYSQIMRDRPDNEHYMFENQSLVYIVQGKEDHIVACKRMADFDQVLQVTYLDDCGHMGHIEQNTTSFAILGKLLC